MGYLVEFFQTFFIAVAISLLLLLGRVVYSCWFSPVNVYRKLQKNGFTGPPPSFPLGNLSDMRKKENKDTVSFGSLNISHDIHSTVFPYFARWTRSYGKVFIYWLGTEPFVYIGEPEFLREMAAGVMGKCWGKPNVFKHDRKPMFGNGLVMVEGDDWVRHRNVITPAFSPANLKATVTLMVDSTTTMLDKWSGLIASSEPEINIEEEIIGLAAEIIAKTSFGINHDHGREVFDKLRAMQVTLFRTNRFVGVPYGNFLSIKKTLESRRLGKEIDSLLSSIITYRQANVRYDKQQKDLLGLLLVEGRNGKKLSTSELVDECKTFFFAGHETTALALTWTLFLLGLHPEWQNQLREEIQEVMGDSPLDSNMLAKLKKMGWVMNEVLRLYSAAPNVQRQARGDIRIGDVTIPNGTNIWIDVVGMHHDPTLWGEDVNEFKPERFKEDMHGGCNHKMGFLPFGFGGRMCVGRNLSMMEYKVVLALILTRFSFTLSPSYCHSPVIMLSLRPNHGLPLVLKHI